MTKDGLREVQQGVLEYDDHYSIKNKANRFNERQYQWCFFLRDRRWSAKQKHVLFDHFGSIEAVLKASLQEQLDVVKSAAQQHAHDVQPRSIEQDLHWLSMSANHLIGFDDSRYPQSLRQLPDPPLALFAQGDVSLLNEPQVAIVGSRRPTPIGEKVVGEIASELAGLGIVITSGMALGIDGMAHQSAISGGGGTIAVMGCGIDIIYPARNKGLHDEISKQGLIISEFPLGMQPTRYTFPMRNRIVSGLALGVIIVEAAENSGTLITAGFASEQNKEVMVVPGSVLSRQYKGSHELIKNGAALVSCAKDVLHCLSTPLNFAIEKTKEEHIEGIVDTSAPLENSVPKPNKYHALLTHIGAESTPVDSIVINSGLTTAEVSAILIELELSGHVAVSHDGGYLNLT